MGLKEYSVKLPIVTQPTNTYKYIL